MKESIHQFRNTLILIVMAQSVARSSDVERSDVFCEGNLLHTVQMARIFEDSKTFVDMKMKTNPDQILSSFEVFMDKCNRNPSKLDVKQFVSDNFEENNIEFIEWNPQDWKENPKFLKNISKESYRKFAANLHDIWKKLGRKIKHQVKDEIDRFSLIWVPNPVIVPGGRFREFYYWDSYWIIKGLMISEMFHTVKGMLDNYLYIVNKYGYIPNGGRIYYLGRSQPPLLIPAFKLYFDETNDIEYLKQSIDTLDREFEFWMKNRTKIVKYGEKDYRMATYGNSAEGPRPESYAEDVDLLNSFKSDELSDSFFSEIRAACESGWDFSSRWFVNNATNKGTLQNIKTSAIIPVDLNAILYGNSVILSDFHRLLGNLEQAEHYKDLSQKLFEAINEVLWHDEVGVWLDYDCVNEVRRDYFHSSNLVPLWIGCYDKSIEDEIVDKNLHYLDTKNILNFPGGIPQTLEHTGEQWDFPNAWPPSVHMIIFGLKRTNHPKAQIVARELASKWLISNYEAFERTKSMAEKFDATILGESGGGGEYKVQFGFGWTNGVILDILVNFFTE